MIDIAFVNETTLDVSNYEKIITQVIQEAAIYETIENFYEISIIFVNQDKIQTINKEYRGIDKVTDVISFALFDDEEENLKDEGLITTLGDIFICIDQAKSQAEEYDHSIEREMGFLACHGFLHLLGYDHCDEDEEQEMFQKQEDILNRLNLVRNKG